MRAGPALRCERIGLSDQPGEFGQFSAALEQAATEFALVGVAHRPDDHAAVGLDNTAVGGDVAGACPGQGAGGEHECGVDVTDKQRAPEQAVDHGAVGIVDADEAPPELIYDTLLAPPVDRIDRRFRLDEIRYSPNVRMLMPSIDLNTINFELGSWEITPDQGAKLQVIADGLNRAIQGNPREVFLIEGTHRRDR